MNIWTQKSASIQKRTSRPKCADTSLPPPQPSFMPLCQLPVLSQPALLEVPQPIRFLMIQCPNHDTRFRYILKDVRFPLFTEYISEDPKNQWAKNVWYVGSEVHHTVISEQVLALERFQEPKHSAFAQHDASVDTSVAMNFIHQLINCIHHLDAHFRFQSLNGQLSVVVVVKTNHLPY